WAGQSRKCFACGKRGASGDPLWTAVAAGFTMKRFPVARGRRAPMSDATPADTLAALLVEQRRRWQRGDRVPVAAVLQRLPDPAGNVEGVLDLIYNELLLREELGELPQVAEYQQRFPHLAEQLRIQFKVDRAMVPGTAARSRSPTPPADDAQ